MNHFWTFHKLDIAILNTHPECYCIPSTQMHGIGTSIEQLRSEKQQLMTDNAIQTDIKNRVDDMIAFLDEQDEKTLEYSDQVVRRMVEKITIFDEKITVAFKSGIPVDINK